MAVSLKTAGTWAAVTGDSTVTLVGTPAAGDRYFIFASWKTFSITSNVPGWTQVTEFADGSVAAGNGTGSMKVTGWYRNWESGDANPTLDFSAAPTIGAVCCMLWQKGAGEVWDDPIFVTAAWPSQSTGTLNASSALAVPSGSVVMGLMGIPDDSALFTRVATSIGGSGITFNGDFVESPVTHLTTTTGQDMAADLGHRFVTTGATATLTQTATLSAAETGAALWVVQGVSTANPVTVTPSAGSLTLTGSAPVLGAGVIPAAVALTATGAVPVLNAGIRPIAAALTLTGQAPTVITALTPYPPGTQLPLTFPYVFGVIVLTGVAPNVTLGFDIDAGGGSLTVTGSTPTVSTPTTVTPAAASLTLTGAAPTVLTPLLLTPTAGSLTLTGPAPTVLLPQLVTPGAATTVLTGSEPTVTVGGGGAPTTVTPTAGSLTLTGSAPQLDTSLRPAGTSAALTGSAPRLDFGIRPASASAALTGSAPTITISGPQTVTPTGVALTLTGYAPSLTPYIPVDEVTTLVGTRPGALALSGRRDSTSAMAGSRFAIALAGARDTPAPLAGASNEGLALAGTQRTESDL